MMLRLLAYLMLVLYSSSFYAMIVEAFEGHPTIAFLLFILTIAFVGGYLIVDFYEERRRTRELFH